MTKIDPNIVILLTAKADAGYGNIYAGAYVQNNGLHEYHENGKILNPQLGDSYGWAEKYHHLSDLRTSAQYDVTDPERTYGWHIEYGSHMFIRLEEADVMLKTLRRLDREMTKLTNQLGYADTFGEWIARFALIIGCNKFGVREPELTPNGTPYRWFDAQGMRYWVSKIHMPAKTNV